MAKVSVHLATTQKDFEAAQSLCLDWLDWHWNNYPSDWPRGVDHPMDPENFRTVVHDLAKLHARPGGAILLGSVDGNPAGCVMYHDAGDGVAEFKRMFVGETGRGHRLGQLMLSRMFEQMIKDGYQRVFFSSATFLTHAKAMYENAGFVPMPQPEGFPEAWKDRVYFMERDLSAG